MPSVNNPSSPFSWQPLDPCPLHPDWKQSLTALTEEFPYALLVCNSHVLFAELHTKKVYPLFPDNRISPRYLLNDSLVDWKQPVYDLPAWICRCGRNYESVPNIQCETCFTLHPNINHVDPVAYDSQGHNVRTNETQHMIRRSNSDDTVLWCKKPYVVLSCGTYLSPWICVYDSTDPIQPRLIRELSSCVSTMIRGSFLFVRDAYQPTLLRWYRLPHLNGPGHTVDTGDQRPQITAVVQDLFLVLFCLFHLSLHRIE